MTLISMRWMAASQLVKKIQTIISTCRIVCFSDSMINMKRLQNPINKYESRIAIELLEIKQVLQHVPGVENPADLLTKLRKTNWLNL